MDPPENEPVTVGSTAGGEASTSLLAERARRGDRAAFTQLVERFHRMVYKVVLHRCRDARDAEDVSQDVFLHAYRSIGGLREPDAFVSWLLRIAQHRALRFHRNRARRAIVLAEAADEVRRRAADSAGPAHEDRGAEELVAGLPECERMALRWKYLEGCSYEEIGERLSMSFHQVDYLLRKAKRALRAAVLGARRRLEGSSG